MERKEAGKNVMLAGIDVGSTTVKLVLLDPATREILFKRYVRHNAAQSQSVYRLLKEAHETFPKIPFRVSVCGSGGLPIAKTLGAFYIQEVVANSIAVKTFYPRTRTAVELGGQDAKVIFFREDAESENIVVSDMRMNGSCAGGTGAFIEQIADLLGLAAEDFDTAAGQGKHVYEISGRCGVFAKTDIQPLLSQGVSKEDITLSSFHALVKQTIGGLAQGMAFHPAVLFEGGPLTFNPTLVSVFKERLMLEDHEIIIPENPELIIAVGTALAGETVFHGKPCRYEPGVSLSNLLHSVNLQSSADDRTVPFFTSREERNDFLRRHSRPLPPEPSPAGRTQKIEGYLGIDAGSTTTKFAFIDTKGEVFETFYANNEGDALQVIKRGLSEFHSRLNTRGIDVSILGCGTTGYGEQLFARALHADNHNVETVAHARAASTHAPDATFILDIGGQDMKAISLNGGIITGIVLNEACSAGCGSFIETYAGSLGIPVDAIAERAFSAENPSQLGSRCTVFMNSSIVTEQKHGKTANDILAGLCRSIIGNVFTKVLRMANLEGMGNLVVAQGGTFKNDAVLRAFEQYLEAEGDIQVTRPPYPGEMGAIGIALLTKEEIEKKLTSDPEYTSTFIGLDRIEELSYRKIPGVICNHCSNNCNRSIIEFNDGTVYVTGNRCPRGEVVGSLDDPDTKKRLKETNKRMKAVPDLLKEQRHLLFKDYDPKRVSPDKDLTVGIPRVLDFWSSIPFWKTTLEALGFRIVLSAESSYSLYERGLASVPSDTVCFPAKLSHGHILDLVEKKVDRIFMPMMVRVPKINRTADGNHVCSVIQGYPVVVEKSDDPENKYGVPFDIPTFHWYNEKLKYRQTIRYFSEQFSIPRIEVFRAVKEGDKAMSEYRRTMAEMGNSVIANLGTKYPFGIVVAGRPYHSDPLVNHHVSSCFTSEGIPVLVLDALPHTHTQDLSNVRIETTIASHTKMLEGTLCVAKNPYLEMVQVVSFGCGHDAVVSDEMYRILQETSNKELLILKMDEGDARGPFTIRIKSFLETVRFKREQKRHHRKYDSFKELKNAFTTKFLRRHKRTKTVLVPNLSPAFSAIIGSVMKREGYKVFQMPLADREAIELGKRYVHNDICFPAQVNIGETLRCLRNGGFDPGNVAVGFAKNCEDCRAGQYAALARKALDEAGYPQVPIMTTGQDRKNMHPGAQLSPFFYLDMIWGLVLMDSLEMMKRSTRPYECNKGETDRLFSFYLEKIAETVTVSHQGALHLLARAVDDFNALAVWREKPRPRVGIVGEIFLNYHPVSNGRIEHYLEDHGMEVIIPPMLDFFRRSFVIDKNKAKRNLLPNPFFNLITSGISDIIIEGIKKKADKILRNFRFNHHTGSTGELVKNIEDMIDVSYIVGEGWLIPAEIIQLIKEGVHSFIIIQPFGCLPNHITGRGMIKAVKERYPYVQILPLDYDPDTSFANIENRLQMLILTAKEFEKSGIKGHAKAS
jgi:predicted CoA-substrate-specific enzyme activase